MKKEWWFRLPFLLVVIAGVAAALIFDRTATRTYDSTVDATARWLRTRAASERLETYADTIDETVHDAFNAKEVGDRALRIHQMEREFNRALDETRRVIVDDMPDGETRRVFEAMSVSKTTMQAIAGDSDAVVALLASGNRAVAAERMESLDRGHARLRRTLNRIGDTVSEWQQRDLDDQRRAVQVLHRNLFAIVVLMTFAVFGIAGVGQHRVRQAIKDREARKREEEMRRTYAAFESASIGIAFVNPSGEFEYVNSVHAALVQRTPAEILGTVCTDTVHPDDRAAIVDCLPLIPKGDRRELEVRLLRAGGSSFEARIIVSPSFDEKGAFAGFYWFYRDITEQRRAAEALRKSEERFHLASRALNDVIFDWDVRTGDAWASEAWMTHFGYPSFGDVGNLVWREAIHPGDRDRVLQESQEALAAGGDSLVSEYRLKRGDGTYVDVLTHAYVVRDENGAPLRMIGATMDISARKRAQRAITAQILNATDDGIYVIDPTGSATFVNRSALQIFGWSAEELLGKNMHELVHHHHADGMVYDVAECPGRITVQTGKPMYGDREILWRKDGTYIPIEYNCNVLRDNRGEVTGAVVTFRDISARRAVERMKDEFVSVVSHELRTPLTAIRGALGLLDGGLLVNVNPPAKHMLRVAVSNTERLSRLINDILDMERMEEGKVVLDRHNCNAQSLMMQAIDAMKPIADKSNVKITCGSCDSEVFVDPDRITQAFTNLLGNAVKFSPAGSEITLSAKPHDGTIEFEVRDHGRGIPHDKLEKIFERFQQVDASDSREKGGTGLGLAICRSIVTQHGGRIWAEDFDGDGAAFHFTIPLTPAEQPHQS